MDDVWWRQGGGLGREYLSRRGSAWVGTERVVTYDVDCGTLGRI